MEALFTRQGDIINELKRIKTNFDKDSVSRKTSEYIQLRVTALDQLWGEFEQNNKLLLDFPDKQHEYYTNNIYEKIKEYYESQRHTMTAFPVPSTSTEGPIASTPSPDKKSMFDIPDISKDNKATAPGSEELLSQQRTNFRAFSRVCNRIDIDSIEEKWEIEDQIKDLQYRWRAIDELHLRIDNILQGSDDKYETDFSQFEKMYCDIKRRLNRKLSSSTHLQHSTPKVDIPVFTGRYSQWPTFFDLFTETIHNNNGLSKAQKMQYLKGKLRGEAERLVQHLTISAENYDTAWDILTHRYNNPQALFTNHIETFLSQPTVHKQTSFELKRLHDTTMECIHAIHNLGVDTTTWDPLLVHLICKKLDSVTYCDYKEARKSPRDLPSFEELMTFIESKFTALEPITKKEKELTEQKSTFQPHQKSYNKPNYQPNYQSKFRNQNYKAAATFTLKCPLCSGEHDLYQCKRFLNMTAETKIGEIAKQAICKNCLYKHNGKPCNSTKRCKYCDDYHNSIIHDDIMQLKTKHLTPTTSSSMPSTSHDNCTKSPSNKQHNVNYVAADDEQILLTTILLKVRAADNNYITLRALLDQGSQISLISEHTVQALGLPRQRYHASVSGIGAASKQGKGIVNLDCMSIYGDFQLTTQALVISRVISSLPNNTFNKQSWPHLQHINLADPEYNVSKSIDLLLDASVYSDIIMSGLIKGPPEAPIAQQTKLGWVLSGNVKLFKCHVVVNNVDDIAKFWEIEGINDTEKSLTEQEQYCENFYQSTTRKLDNGRYEVALPMKPNFEEHLGSSRTKAVSQFIQMEKRMTKNEFLLQAYRKFMNEYHDLHHMRPATQITSMPTCYLPHHGVIKTDSTTSALRVVFNASSKTSSGHSLNDLMECGPNLQQDLQGLVLKWRMYKYVITADIEKMFRQILIREQDSYLQTIIWRDTPYDDIREFHLTTVTYGTKAAPFLAIRTLRQIAQDNAIDFPLAATALENSFYMDDLMSGHDNKEQVIELQKQLVTVLKQAGMNLRKWSSNDPDLVQHLPTNQLNSPFEFKDTESRKTLGLRWNPSSDTFSFQNKINYDDKATSNTKRLLLSDISKIYDPLGWLSPITVKAKMLFQRTWLSDMKWDDELPTDIKNDWIDLRDDLKNIDKFDIDRYMGNRQTAHLHGFCDASEKAYASAVYLTTRNDKGGYTTRLVAAKTKLAPHSKQISLPRLELLGALLLSQLLEKVVSSISSCDISISAWTDSMVVLGWLQGDISRWKQFVANRVRQIINVIPASQWHHVRSEENAADCATRGMTTDMLQGHRLWWEGPQWLNSPDPKPREDLSKIESPTIEVKKSCVTTALSPSEDNSIITQLIKNNSSITKVVRIVGWVSRFISRLQNKQSASELKTHALTTIELQAALNLVVKSVQQLEFRDDIRHLEKNGHVRSSSKLLSLNPFLDNDGILRVGGRLRNAPINYFSKHPIILSPHSRLTELIINQAHITTLHGGPRLTLSFIRNNFWIIGGIRFVKTIIRLCVKCRRYSQENMKQIMADLPAPRVTPSRPFTNTGVDFTGHVDIKCNKGRGIKTTKGYIAVFVCLVTKAVHLELVSDLTTAAFLAAFRRMCARRGTPAHVYSDNGTNFVGADRVLRKEYKAITETLDTSFIENVCEMGVTWHFNAPAWPSAGGLWEAAVKSMKAHLKRTLGDQKLTYEEFITLLYQIEACMNSRPLSPLTENNEDDNLTPGHFLIGDSLLSRPQTDPDIVKLPTRWHLVQSMNKHFWKKWSHEYLQQLQTRSKWRSPSKNIEVNDIVIIKEDNLPPGKWAIARVLETHPGKDGYVRVVSLKTQNNIIKRPVNKLILLPLVNDMQQHSPGQTKTQPQPPQPPATTSKGHRGSRRMRNNLQHFMYLTLMLFMTFFSASVQQTTAPYNITALKNSQSFYFDKVSELKHIRDEWKLVIYYNMTTYWRGLSDIRNYVTYLDSLCKADTQYHSVVLQLQHELTEIEHFNDLLKYHNNNRRMKRGLINGIGYLANSLFGVLDNDFAEKYKVDIEKISKNENHLQSLLRNQTLVVESEYNIIRRNEQTMNQQFALINRHLRNLTIEAGKVRLDFQTTSYKTSSALAASIILANLRRIQDTLLNTVTDIMHGRIDAHLFSPEQLEKQTSIIISHLHGALMLPTEDIRHLYKLLKVFTRIVENYLIIEVKIPLVSTEIYELDRIITIPQKEGESVRYVISAYPYIAFNLKKNMAFLLSESDLAKCVHAKEDILCSLDEPIYDLKSEPSICEMKLINSDTSSVNASPCTTHVSACTADKWVKLHAQNSWLYSCCNECKIRIFYSLGIELKSMTGNGILTLDQGCTVKGDYFTIYSHTHFLSKMHTEEAIKTPDISILNTIINSSFILNDIPSLQTENHDGIYTKLKSDIEQLKVEAGTQLNIHDIHHYAISYVGLAAFILMTVVVVYCWRRYRQVSRAPPSSEYAAAPAARQLPPPPPQPRHRALSVDDLGPSPIAPRRFSIPSF